MSRPCLLWPGSWRPLWWLHAVCGLGAWPLVEPGSIFSHVFPQCPLASRAERQSELSPLPSNHIPSPRRCDNALGLQFLDDPCHSEQKEARAQPTAGPHPPQDSGVRGPTSPHINDSLPCLCRFVPGLRHVHSLSSFAPLSRLKNQGSPSITCSLLSTVHFICLDVISGLAVCCFDRCVLCQFWVLNLDLVQYFSTIERSQFTHYPGLESRSCLGSVGHDHLSPRSSLPKSSNWGELERPVTSDSSTLYSNCRPRITSTDQRFYANLPEKIKRRHLTEEELLIAHDRPKSTPEAVKEPLDQGKKRPSQEMRMQSPQSSPGLSEDQSSFSSVQRRKSDREPCRSDSNRPDSFYDSFRWLEDEEGLDLRLYLDDYHINLREEVPVPNKSRRPSFRRHLSINKLPFGRPSVSYTRPLPREGVVSPTSISPSASQNSAIGSSGHIRRKSRALSLVSPNKQMSPRSSPPIDPAATHYQDPEARQKLRAYLASPQKFDEAIEFGFPSKDGSPREPTFTRPVGSKKENAKEPEKFRSFLEDDRSSKYSDDASVAEPDSPKTPQLFDKPAPVRPARTSTEQPPCAARSDKSVLDQACCREMTLRMTLTRPDLRQSEDQIYGWKQPGSSRGGSSRDDPSTNTVIYARDGNPKESIEKQLAALDEWGEDADHDNGVVKRFWNRVKRT
ncbi:hypothetical protein FSOLCH5_000903 [Fusarium solani]